MNPLLLLLITFLWLVATQALYLVVIQARSLFHYFRSIANMAVHRHKTMKKKTFRRFIAAKIRSGSSQEASMLLPRAETSSSLRKI
jgi:hypothetical protein